MANSHEPASWFAPPDDEGWSDEHEHEDYEACEEIEATDEDFVDEVREHGIAYEECAGAGDRARKMVPQASAPQGFDDEGWVLESVAPDRRAGMESPSGAGPSSRGSLSAAELDEPAWALGGPEEDQRSGRSPEAPERGALEDARQSSRNLDGSFAYQGGESRDEAAGGECEARPAAWAEEAEGDDPEAAWAVEAEGDDHEAAWDGEAEGDDHEAAWDGEEADSYDVSELEYDAWEEAGPVAEAEAASMPDRDTGCEQSPHAPRLVRARVAGMQARCLAWAVDGAMVITASALLIMIAGLAAGTGGAVSMVLRDAAVALPAAIFTALLGAVYSAGTVALLGRTVGGIVAGVGILDGRGLPPDLLRASMRGLIAAFGVLAIGAGLIWVLLDEQDQTLHDRLAGTFAVES